MNILENALGNAAADIMVGILITVFITRYFEKLAEKKKTIGALVIVESEIQVNTHILEDVLYELIPAFENAHKRGATDEIHVLPTEFEDAARFIRIPIDGLLYQSYRNEEETIGALQNHALAERIINLYTVEYHYKIQTSFKMEQLNWLLLDNIKTKLEEKIKLSKEIDNEIKNELIKQRARNTLFETLFAL